MTGFAPHIVTRQRKKGVVYEARIRGSKNVRRCVGSFDSREEALAACHTFIATGERPARKRRGPQKGCRMPRKVRAPIAPPTRGKPAGEARIDAMKAIWARLQWGPRQ